MNGSRIRCLTQYSWLDKLTYYPRSRFTPHSGIEDYLFTPSHNSDHIFRNLDINAYEIYFKKSGFRFIFKVSEIDSEDYELLKESLTNKQAKNDFLAHKGISKLYILLAQVSLAERTYTDFLLTDTARDEAKRLSLRYGEITHKWKVESIEEFFDSENIESLINNYVLVGGNFFDEVADINNLIKYLEETIRYNEVYSDVSCLANTKHINYRLKQYLSSAKEKKIFLHNVESFVKQQRRHFFTGLRLHAETQMRSLNLLKKWLEPSELEQIINNGCLMVRSKIHEGKYYVLHPNRDCKTYLCHNGERVDCLCIDAIDHFLPEPDILLAKYLMIKFDERWFLRTADHSNREYVLDDIESNEHVYNYDINMTITEALEKISISYGVSRFEHAKKLIREII